MFSCHYFKKITILYKRASIKKSFPVFIGSKAKLECFTAKNVLLLFLKLSNIWKLYISFAVEEDLRLFSGLAFFSTNAHQLHMCATLTRVRTPEKCHSRRKAVVTGGETWQSKFQSFFFFNMQKSMSSVMLVFEYIKREELQMMFIS